MKRASFAALGPAAATPPATLRRRGLIAVVVMVGLLVAAMIATAMVRATAARYRLVQREAQRMQAARLADSGIERAAARLAAEPDFNGETWQLPADRFDGRTAGTVEIRVELVEPQPERRKVTSTGQFPAGSEVAARVTRTITLRLTAPAQDTNP